MRMLRFVVAATAARTSAAVLTESYVRTNAASLWASFKSAHQRQYASPDEDAARRSIFVSNMLGAAAEQERNPLASFGATSLSDLTPDEFGRRLGYRPPLRNATVPDHFTSTQVAAAAASVDWRAKGAVTAVKDQGDCGGCWSFSSTGNIEGQWAVAGHGLTPLSEQQLLSCDDYFPCMGCGGGEMSCAFTFLTAEKGGKIATEASYPYTSGAKGGPVANCKGSGTAGATIKGQKDIATSESQMATWLATHGPISIGAYATQWQQYTGGIMTSCGNDTPNHAILIVGYGNANGQDYWIIKNSWGTSWGESGYIRLAKGKNLCKVASQPTTATV